MDVFILVVFLVAMAIAAYWLSGSESSSVNSLKTRSPPRRDPQLRIDQCSEWERIVRGEKTRSCHCLRKTKAESGQTRGAASQDPDRRLGVDRGRSSEAGNRPKSNGMDSSSPTGINVPDWKCQPPVKREGVQDEEYPRWRRFGKERVSDSRR
jgi:hypothetical protein